MNKVKAFEEMDKGNKVRSVGESCCVVLWIEEKNGSSIKTIHGVTDEGRKLNSPCMVTGIESLLAYDNYELVPKSGYEEIKEILPEITRICSGVFDDFEEGLASINAAAAQIEQICKREMGKE